MWQADGTERAYSWSATVELGTEGVSNSSYGRGLVQAAENARPVLGQRRTLEVEWGERNVAVELLAEEVSPVRSTPHNCHGYINTSAAQYPLIFQPSAQGLPTIRLKVVPPAVVHNCTECDLILTCVGVPETSIGAYRSEPIDWQPLRQQARRATLSCLTDGARLICTPFNLETGEVLLALRRASPGTSQSFFLSLSQGTHASTPVGPMATRVKGCRPNAHS